MLQLVSIDVAIGLHMLQLVLQMLQHTSYVAIILMDVAIVAYRCCNYCQPLLHQFSLNVGAYNGLMLQSLVLILEFFSMFPSLSIDVASTLFACCRLFHVDVTFVCSGFFKYFVLILLNVLAIYECCSVFISVLQSASWIHVLPLLGSRFRGAS
jgi:hypothetical protein